MIYHHHICPCGRPAHMDRDHCPRCQLGAVLEVLALFAVMGAVLLSGLSL